MPDTPFSPRPSDRGAGRPLTGEAAPLDAHARGQERRFRASFEQAAVGMALVALDGRFLDVNAAYCEIMGYTRDELLTRAVRDVTYPGDRDASLDGVTRLMAGQMATVDMEKRYVRKDGSLLWGRLIVSLARAESGASLYLIAVLEDITERKRVEAERAAALERERLAREEAETVTRELRLVQTVADAALSRLSLDALLPELLERARAALEVDNATILLVDDERQTLHVRASCGVLEEASVQVSMPVGLGFAGRIAATRQPLIVPDLRDFPVQSPVFRDTLRSAMGVPIEAEGRTLGVLHVGCVEQHAFTPRDTLLLQVVAERIARPIEHARLYDLARRAQAEAEARACDLEETTRRMDDFVSMVNHELNTPLTSIRPTLQLMRRRLNQLFENQATADAPERELVMPERIASSLVEMTVRCERQVERMTRLVGDLLTASRSQRGALDIKPTPTDLVALVHGVVEEQRQAWPGRALVIHAPSAPVVALVDATRVGQALANYVTNALKYAPSEQPVTVTLAVAGNEARVSVRDEGPGLPPDEQERVWRRFHRAEGVAVQNGSGVSLGLGLYISKSVIERHGGRVGVESAQGRGATFWFTLPLAGASADAA